MVDFEQGQKNCCLFLFRSVYLETGCVFCYLETDQIPTEQLPCLETGRTLLGLT